MATLQELVDDLTWRHLKVKDPGLFVNPDSMAALGPESVCDQLSINEPLSFATGMPQIPRYPSPPSIGSFESLPNP